MTRKKSRVVPPRSAPAFKTTAVQTAAVVLFLISLSCSRVDRKAPRSGQSVSVTLRHVCAVWNKLIVVCHLKINMADADAAFFLVHDGILTALLSYRVNASAGIAADARQSKLHPPTYTARTGVCRHAVLLSRIFLRSFRLFFQPLFSSVFSSAAFQPL